MELTYLSPKLRFPMFKKQWNEISLRNIASFSKGKGISKSDLLDNGIVPCILYGELYTKYGEVIDKPISRTSINIANLVFSNEDDVIIPSSGETHIDIAKAACIRVAGIALGGDLNIIRTACNGVFLSYYLNGPKKLDIARLSQGNSVVHLYNKQLASLNIIYPSLPEQQKIATFLSAVDKKIQLLTRKKELLEQYKKGVMQKIFSCEIRFKDENGKDYPEWEEKKLGEITYKVGKKNKKNISYPIYSINNQEGFLPQSEQFVGLDSNDRGYDISMYKIIHPKTFAYNPARINVGSIGYSNELDDVIISSLYVCFKTRELLEDLYLLAYLETFTFNKDILRYEEGGVRQYLFYENFSQIRIPLPSNREQKCIATFLSRIDSKIEKIALRISATQQFKKGLLQQMFV